jgi:hypothetical protein
LQVTFLFLAELSLIVSFDLAACHHFSQFNQKLVHAYFRRNQEEYGVAVNPVAVASFVGDFFHVRLQTSVDHFCIYQERRMGNYQR